MQPRPRDDERLALAGVVAAVLLAQVAIYPGVPDVTAALGLEGHAAERWFLAAEFAAFIAVAPLWGALSDRLGTRVPLIAAGALGGAAGYGLLAALPLGQSSVYLLRVLQGAATVGAFSLAITMLSDLPGGHGRNMGAAGLAVGTGTALGAPIGGHLTDLDPRFPLLFAAGLLGIVGLTVLAVPDRAPAGDRSLGRALTVLRDHLALGVPFAFGFADRFTAGFFALVGTLYFREVWGLDAAATGIALALFFAPFALLQYPFGVLSDRIGRVIPVAGGSAFYGVAVAAVGLAPSLLAAQVGMVAIGVLGALMAPATFALTTDLAPEHGRGVALAGFNAVGSLGFLVGIVGGGILADRLGFQTAFVAAGASELALAVLLLPALWNLEVAVAS
jgi:MFS family permease